MQKHLSLDLDKSLKIIVGMSGGIDSTAVVAKLKKSGHNVVGMTLKALNSSGEYGKCCSLEDIMDAKKVCSSLKIPHYTINVQQEFETKIIQYFVDEYLNGKTPNPCLYCNSLIKLKYLSLMAEKFGCSFIATGHYAKLNITKQGEVQLKKACDLKKDQSYFLSRVPKDILKMCLFPLGNSIKSETIAWLKENNIPIYKKRESHEICFVPKTYRDFLQSRVPEKIKPGKIVSEDGKELGKHDGIPFFTIGQRRGLQIAATKPLYVKNLDVKNNTVVVGNKPMEKTTRIIKTMWLHKVPNIADTFFKVKVRVFHDGTLARLHATDKIDEWELWFETEVFSVTPGQAAVGYLDDVVCFSGIIE